MPPRDWKLRVADIIESAELILQYVEGATVESLSRDRKTVDAVVRNFTIIGEAARSIPPEIKDRHPEIPWADMLAMRNFVTHVYFGVSLVELLKTAKDDLPPLTPRLRRLFESDQRQ
jgi:uncharacterized protein with HEPN domain